MIKGKFEEVSIVLKSSQTKNILEFVIEIKTNEIIKGMRETVIRDDFKSIGEYAFENIVKKFRNHMGWKV